MLRQAQRSGGSLYSAHVSFVVLTLKKEKSRILILLTTRKTVISGQHRALGSSLSKVRSLKMDNKVWTEPLIQVRRG